jgi:hypothetical protein
MIPFQFERRIASFIVVLGLGWWTPNATSDASQGKPVLSVLTQRAGCTAEPVEPFEGALDAGTCQFGDATAVFAIFDSDDARDHWIVTLRVMAMMPNQGNGRLFFVEGDRWAVGTGSVTLAEALARSLHGSVTG